MPDVGVAPTRREDLAREMLRARLAALCGLACTAAAEGAEGLRIELGTRLIAARCARRVDGGAPGLVGRTITDAALLEGGDLALRFDDALMVRLFCDGRGARADRQWGLAAPGVTWEVRPPGHATCLDDEGDFAMSQADRKAGLEEALGRLVGRRCWCALPAGPHGALQLGFGLKLPREFELQVDAFPEEFRTHAPELGLHVECAWRLDGPEGVLCGARDGLVLDGRLGRGLARLVDAEVERCELAAAAGDLVLAFAPGGLVLRVFADRVAADRGEDNYTLALPGEMITVGPGGVVRRERVADRPPLRVVR